MDASSEAKEADMGCWHGCGPWYGWPPPRGWYGPPPEEAEWYEEEDWPMRRRRHRRERSSEGETSTASLEARLDELHAELRRVELALDELRRPPSEAPRDRTEG
jgi:hypothetical protein